MSKDVAENEEQDTQSVEETDNELADDELADEKTTRWNYPDLSDPNAAEDTRTNVFNKPLKWQYEPPEADDDESDEPQPLTAEQLEEIRQAARDEGFAEGKQEGIEAGHKEGLEAGFTEGREAGHAEGFASGKEAGEAHINELTKQWQELIEQTYAPLSVIDDEVEQQLVQMVLELSRAICLHEVTQSAESIRQAVQRGIQALPITERKVMIKLNPDDIERVREAFGSETIEQEGWVFSKDEHMEPGGCEITTSSSTVDVSLRKRMKDVFQRVLGSDLDAKNADELTMNDDDDR
ncbi:MAG: flagellar assembly protein FliH [Idiomarina sp.]